VLCDIVAGYELRGVNRKFSLYPVPRNPELATRNPEHLCDNQTNKFKKTYYG